MKKLFIFLLFSVLIYASSFAQPISVNGNLSDNDLVQTLAGPGVIISNVTVTAAAGSYGQFTSGLNGAPSIGIGQGVLLTTGTIQNAVGPNNATSQSTNNGAGGNALLDALNQGASLDATVIEFDIRTTGTTLRFDYVFGSEEYHEFVNSQFNDVFGLFISGPGISGTQNIALIPGTTTPVAINTVNDGETNACQSPGPGINSQFFVDNCNGGAVEYDGFTRVLRAIRNNLQSCQTYHVTLAIADVGDRAFDSGVFIAEGSFNSAGGTGFTVAINCNDGNWSVTATATDPMVVNNQWQLWATDVEGATSGGTLVSTINGGLVRTFSGLDLSRHYYIRHISTICGTVFETVIAVPDFGGNGTAFFTIEDENGVEQTVFCAGENIFMDGTGSNNYDRFFLNSTRRPAGSPPGTPFQHHADYGWTIDNSIGVLNLTNEFLNNGLNPGEIFEPGFEYEIFLAIANIPECIPWTVFRQTFTVICCDADPAFTVEASCDGGSWSVTATPIGTEPTNHSWQLYETTVNGATSGGTPVGVSQNGTTATFTWLDQSKFYYIKHRIWINGCYVEEFSVAVPGFSAEATLTYKLMNEAGQQKEVYCFGEDIFLDATGSSNYDRYFMAIWRRPITGGSFSFYANYGWTFPTGPNGIGIINLSQLFLTSGENPGEIFEPGYVYELQFAIANPQNCVPWIELKRQFIVECCEDFLSANFKLDLVDSEGGFSLVVYDFEAYANVGATHTWTVLSSPNPNGGPYTLVVETTTSGAGPIILYNQGSSGLYYFVIHKLSTLCGDFCYGKRREGNNGTTPGSEPDGGEACDLCGPIDCGRLDEICFAPQNETAYCSSFPQQAVTFVWSPVQGATQYRLQITYNDPACCGGSGIPQTANYNISNVNYISLGGLQRFCFKWRVGVVCEGQIVWADYHCFTGCDAIPGGGGGIGLAAPGQATIATAATVHPQVYPNPANDELNVVLPVDAKADLIKVIDLQGKVVFEQRNPEQHLKIDSSKFIAGMYAIQIIYPDGSHSVEQIVITH